MYSQCPSVTLLHKISSLDQDDVKNYCLVFLYLQTYCKGSCTEYRRTFIAQCYQSAFNRGPSTETFLSKVHSNILKMIKDKTELIVFSSKQHVKKTGTLHIKVGASYIKYAIFVNLFYLILNNILVTY